jgi:hypothetical protein
MKELRDDANEFVDSTAGQLATKYDISVFKAREILGRCGPDEECIMRLAEEAHRENPGA